MSVLSYLKCECAAQAFLDISCMRRQWQWPIFAWIKSSINVPGKSPASNPGALVCLRQLSARGTVFDQINPRGPRKGHASHRTTHSAWVRGRQIPGRNVSGYTPAERSPPQVKKTTTNVYVHVKGKQQTKHHCLLHGNRDMFRIANG